MAVMEPENVQLGKKIEAARLARGWSRSDLARRAHVDPSYVTRIEEAHYKRPSVDKVRAIAAALKIHVTDLTEPIPVPAKAVDMRAALVAKGFRPDETYIVDQILDDMVEHDADERSELLTAVATILAVRSKRPPDA
jgi:transcriptional regulator with XRE-family HTH domain